MQASSHQTKPHLMTPMRAIHDHERTTPIAPLTANEIQLWYAAVDETWGENHYEQLRACLSDEEQARAVRFVFARHRREYVVAHGMSRLILAHHVGKMASELQFKNLSHGKPVLVGYGGEWLQFNISHTDGMAVMACTIANPVGVDIESSTRLISRDLAERCFTSEELAEDSMLPALQQDAGLVARWTLKEAFIKAQGHGLQFPLWDVSFCRHTTGGAKIRFAPGVAEDSARWWCATRWLPTRHVASVVVRRSSSVLPNLTVRDFERVLWSSNHHGAQPESFVAIHATSGAIG